MAIRNKITKTALLLVGLAFTAVANAVIVYPVLDIQQLAGDAGVISTATGLTMDATAITVINSDKTVVYDFVDQNFFLTSDVGGSGSVSVGSGVTLTADFSNLTLFNLGGGFGTFVADLTYTGGDMAGSFTGGRIEGAFKNASGAVALGSDFIAGSIVAKLGEVQVVPVPAAVWLFGSGLLGLAGIARRKKVA